MGQFIRVNGDYNIKTANGAKITFDTGPAISGGEVRITGNLVVEGEQTSVQATNLSVEDNIIVLNQGETGTGVSLIYSGIQIDRGSLDPVGILYDETTDAWLFTRGGPALEADGTATPFSYTESRIRVKEILTDVSIKTLYVSDTEVAPSGRYGDLNLIGSGNGVVTVYGTSNYEAQVVHDDDVPNKKYVDDSILNNPTFQILRDNTRVIVADKTITSGPGSLAYLTSTTGFTTEASESAVSVIVDAALVAQFYNNRLFVGDHQSGVTGLEIDGINFEIRTENSVTDEDIFIKTAGTGKLRTNNAVKLDKLASAPTYESGFNLIYAAAPGIGTSGVWFSNDSTEAAKRNGELISKNKALVFSMIF